MNGKNFDKHFCMAPWVHMYIQTNGDVGSCCQLSNNLGSLREKTLEELWNIDENKEMRLSMLKGEEIPACSICYNNEKNGIKSLRNMMNERFGHMIDITDGTEDDGAFKYNFKYVDIRFSNLCNFKCRTCCHTLSSSFYEEGKQLRKKYKDDYREIKEVNV